MKVTVDLKYFLMMIASLLITVGTLNGFVQKYIKFAGAANEMGFFFMALMMTIILAFCSFEKTNKDK